MQSLPHVAKPVAKGPPVPATQVCCPCCTTAQGWRRAWQHLNGELHLRQRLHWSILTFLELAQRGELRREAAEVVAGRSHRKALTQATAPTGEPHANGVLPEHSWAQPPQQPPPPSAPGATPHATGSPAHDRRGALPHLHGAAQPGSAHAAGPAVLSVARQKEEEAGLVAEAGAEADLLQGDLDTLDYQLAVARRCQVWAAFSPDRPPCLRAVPVPGSFCSSARQSCQL